MYLLLSVWPDASRPRQQDLPAASRDGDVVICAPAHATREVPSSRELHPCRQEVLGQVHAAVHAAPALQDCRCQHHQGTHQVMQ